jgi:selenide, water dikinase
MQASSPIVKQLVLVGGGHSHLAVLMHFAMQPLPGLSLTLISRDIITPYSGSLPGFLSGVYQHDDIHIDLRPLAQFANARLIQQEVSDIDLEQKLIHLDSRPAVEFDILSLNIGSRPDASLISGADRYAVGVKPIDRFIEAWEKTRQQAVQHLQSSTKAEFSITFIGGGPASVELAFATQSRIHSDLGLEPGAVSGLRVKIVSADPDVLMLHNQKVRHYTRMELQRRGIEVILQHPVASIQNKQLLSANGDELSSDAIFFATGASIPAWPGAAGLDIGSDGFIEVRPSLQTLRHDFVFAAGDAATVTGEARPKSGVYAVRQGKVLAQNLERFATGRKLKQYFPQRQALALMSMGNGKAIASRGKLFFQGRLMWSLKNRIDTRFVQKFSALPAMKTPLNLAPGLVDRDTERELRNHAMRCAGCGAKVASKVLDQVLRDLPAATREDIISIPGTVEDASIIRLDDERVLLQSVDYLKAFNNDPWLFACIATNHCLSDIHAMGADPHSALAIVGLPQATKKISRSMLNELMQACSKILSAENCSLIGGHSAESAELHFGLCINGFANPAQLLRKDGMQPGDVLLLSKPLGTGTLLAADMRYRASQHWMQAAIEQMLQSSAQASKCLLRHGSTACTDITGFGLAGHLYEMLAAKQIRVEISLDDLPVLAGALDTLSQGITSSLHSDNRQVAEHIETTAALQNQALFELLFDPQTAGGLLASVPAEAAEACLRELQEAGYAQATAIGRVSELYSETAAIILK